MGKEGCVMLLNSNDEFRSRFRNVRPCYWQQYFSGQRFANGRSDHLIDFLKPCTLIQSKVGYHHVIPKTLTAPSLSKDMKKKKKTRLPWSQSCFYSIQIMRWYLREVKIVQFVARSSALGNMYERDNLSPPWGGEGETFRSTSKIASRSTAMEGFHSEILFPY